MTPHAAAEPTFALPADHRATALDCHAAEPGIIGALFDALNGSGGYRLVDRGGELFLEPEHPGRSAASR